MSDVDDCSDDDCSDDDCSYDDNCQYSYSNGSNINITDMDDYPVNITDMDGNPVNQTLQIKCKCDNMVVVDVNFRGNKYELSFVKVSYGMYDDVYEMERFMFKLIHMLVNEYLKWKVEIMENPMWSYVEQIPNFRPHMKQHFDHVLGIQNDNMILYAIDDVFVELYCIYNYLGVPLDITNIIAELCHVLRSGMICEYSGCEDILCGYTTSLFSDPRYNFWRLFDGMYSLHYST